MKTIQIYLSRLTCAMVGLLLLTFSACRREDEPVRPEKDILPASKAATNPATVLAYIESLGFSRKNIEDAGAYFVVEGDIMFPKEVPSNAGGRAEQAHTTALVDYNRVQNIRVRIDASIPVGGTDDWRAEIQQAVGDWNATNGTVINMVMVAAWQTADITFIQDNGLPDNVIARATFPSNGAAGNTVRINLDSYRTYTSTQRRFVMVHELGHCIGLRHTNWAANGESGGSTGAVYIPGTPDGSDGASVMNGSSGGTSWIGFSTADLFAARSLYPNYTQVGGLGWESEGADLAITNLDGDGRPELLLMTYDAPDGANEFRYKVGYNLTDGKALGWTGGIVVPGVGWKGQGAGMAVTNLDFDPRPDLILMAYDAPDGENQFRYKVGFNLNNSGVATTWSGVHIVSGLGWEAQGAGIAIAQLDDNSRPELIFMAYDNPAGANNFRYKVGYNLNLAGGVTAWSVPRTIPGLGWEGQGAGIAITNIDSNPRPEMVLMAYDAPSNANFFRYKIGYNLNAAADPAVWGGDISVPGLGWEGQGAGVCVGSLGRLSSPDLILMAYDNPPGANSFRYKVGWDLYNFGTARSWE